MLVVMGKLQETWRRHLRTQQGQLHTAEQRNEMVMWRCLAFNDDSKCREDDDTLNYKYVVDLCSSALPVEEEEVHLATRIRKDTEGG